MEVPCCALKGFEPVPAERNVVQIEAVKALGLGHGALFNMQGASQTAVTIHG